MTDDDWLALLARCGPRSMLDPERLATFRRLADRLPDGDVVEVGVRDGGTVAVLAGLCPGRYVWACDTFDGMPPLAVGDEAHLARGLYASVPGTPDSLAMIGVACVRGIFPACAPPGMERQRFALAHLDADLWVSTLCAPVYLWPRMSPGGFVVLDDFGRPETPGVRRAVEEFLPEWIRCVEGHQPDLCQLVLRRPDAA